VNIGAKSLPLDLIHDAGIGDFLVFRQEKCLAQDDRQGLVAFKG
jgi:hypothetical protein